MPSVLRAILLLWIALWVGVLSGCGDKTLRLGVTTTVNDSGLLQQLVDQFYQTHGVKLKPIIVGSGRLFSLMERGDIDIAIAHEPEGEKALLARGIISSREPLFYNHFVLVGPQHNPAGIHSSQSKEEVFTTLTQVNVAFVSRADNSGTHRTEENVWRDIGVTPKEQHMIRTGSGMGATLTITAEKQAHTLVDLGTWLNFNNKQQLVVLWQDPQMLRNQYSLLTINPERFPVNQHTHIFTQWIRGEGQQLIKQLRINQQPAFFIED